MSAAIKACQQTPRKACHRLVNHVSSSASTCMCIMFTLSLARVCIPSLHPCLVGLLSSHFARSPVFFLIIKKKQSLAHASLDGKKKIDTGRFKNTNNMRLEAPHKQKALQTRNIFYGSSAHIFFNALFGVFF
jgi:hypothetical protein